MQRTDFLLCYYYSIPVMLLSSVIIANGPGINKECKNLTVQVDYTMRRRL